MRIAQVSPLYESVPPSRYGGTERVVSYLTEELVRRGHEVTLFASGDSETAARLVPCSERALRLAGCPNSLSLAHHMVQLDQVARRAADFDLVHFHIDYIHFPLSKALGIRHVNTLHGRLDLDPIFPCYRRFGDFPFVSISDSQRRPMPWLNWLGTVYHGLPDDLYRLGPGGDRLVFLGRISPEKRVDRAIEIARRSGLPLRIAAKTDPVDGDYFEAEIEPLLSLPGIEFLGEIEDHEKQALLGKALALLMPIDWPEPFGLVMIEAMACGTPVIAFRNGSVEEVVDDGVTGFVVESIEEALTAVERCRSLDRGRCRQRFEQRFSVGRMAADYVRLYASLVESRPDHEQAPHRLLDFPVQRARA
jgi:glycosyltransferase involved in cell wall biosynthesis